MSSSRWRTCGDVADITGSDRVIESQVSRILSEFSMLKNMKVGVRLSIAFGLILALMCVIAAVSVTRLGQMKAATDAIVLDRYAKVALISKFGQSVRAAAMSLRDFILETDPAKMREHSDRVNAANAENEKII